MKRYMDLSPTEQTEWLKTCNAVVNHLMLEDSLFVLVVVHQNADKKDEDGDCPIMISSVGSLPSERIADILHLHACNIQGHDHDFDDEEEEGEEWKNPERN